MISTKSFHSLEQTLEHVEIHLQPSRYYSLNEVKEEETVQLEQQVQEIVILKKETPEELVILLEPETRERRRTKPNLFLKMNEYDEPSVLDRKFTTFQAKRVHQLPCPLPGWKVIKIDFKPGVELDKLLPIHEMDQRITGIEQYVITKEHENEGIDADIYIRAEFFHWLRLKNGEWINFEGKPPSSSTHKLTPKIDWVVHNRRDWWFISWIYIKTCKNNKKSV